MRIAREPDIALLLRVASLSTSALTYWNRAQFCLFANDACVPWFGVDPEFIVGSRLRDLFECVSLGAHVKHAAAALAGSYRAVPHVFQCGDVARRGLLQFVPDLQQGGPRGLLVQVSRMPADLRLVD